MEDFSLIVLCRTKSHLLPLTLDGLRLQTGSFEVLVLDGDGGEGASELALRYPELKLRVQNASGKSLADMMNLGVHLSCGKYIQFLEPGDRYISQHGLECLSDLIRTDPHLIYAGSLDRGSMAQIEPVLAKSPWFLRAQVLELGGFDRKWVHCPSLDLLCRLFRKRDLRLVFCRRVLMELKKDKPESLREMYRIFYRHFGLWRALKWAFRQDHSHTLRRTLSWVKGAFWESY